MGVEEINKRRKNHYDNLPNENHGGSLAEFSLHNFSTEQGPLDYTLYCDTSQINKQRKCLGSQTSLTID